MATLLTAEQIRDALQSLPEWRQDGDAIVRDVSVAPHSQDALESALMDVANRANHHPDIERAGDGMRVVLSTHSAGGITEKDVQLAAQIDQVLSGAGRDTGSPD